MLFRSRKELILVLLVELPSDALVDRLDDSILEECVLLSLRIETRNCAGAKFEWRVRDAQEKIREYTQCEETDATRIPRDDIVCSLENHAEVPSALCNDPDTGAAGPTYSGNLGLDDPERSVDLPGFMKSVPFFCGTVAAYLMTARRALPACQSR